MSRGFSVQGESLYGGVSVQGGLCPGGGGSLSQAVFFQRGDLSVDRWTPVKILPSLPVGDKHLFTPRSCTI